MINVLSAITQTGNREPAISNLECLFSTSDTVLTYHLYKGYYLNSVKTLKSLTYLGIHVYHLRLDIVFLLEAE